MAIAAVLIAYLVGSVSFAVVVSRTLGLADPRTFGSHNPGATNVLRGGNKMAAVLTVLGDGGKGWLAVFLTQKYFAGIAQPEYAMSAAALAVVLGHMYPLYHRFRGGKGVATALGVLLALNTLLAAAVAAIWIAVALVFRISALAALTAAFLAPLLCYAFYGLHPYTAAVGAIAVLLIWRHKANIRNLIAGTERRSTPKPREPQR